MRIRAVVSLMFGLTLAWTTSLAAQAPEALDKIAKDWEAAFNAGDYASVAALYTADARRIPPEADIVVGHDGIVANLETIAGGKAKIGTFSGMLGDDFGTTWGTWEIWQGEEMVDKGRWMNVVKKTADGWKIYRDIWNSSIPEEAGCM